MVINSKQILGVAILPSQGRMYAHRFRSTLELAARRLSRDSATGVCAALQRVLTRVQNGHWTTCVGHNNPLRAIAMLVVVSLATRRCGDTDIPEAHRSMHGRVHGRYDANVHIWTTGG